MVSRAVNVLHNLGTRLPNFVSFVVRNLEKDNRVFPVLSGMISRMMFQTCFLSLEVRVRTIRGIVTRTTRVGK